MIPVQAAMQPFVSALDTNVAKEKDFGNVRKLEYENFKNKKMIQGLNTINSNAPFINNEAD